jgi:hypothetical protein
MGVDHCGSDVFVAHELLNQADVLAPFQEVGGEGMVDGVACCLGDTPEASTARRTAF